jgi:predicted MFS family arabinose efflux permease
VSLLFEGRPWVSVSVLLAGRALLGAAESYIITGAATWGLGVAGPQNAGRVIAWVGMAMFAAMAVGAPVGMSLYALGGFVTVAAATAMVPVRTLLFVMPLHSVSARRGKPAEFLKVARAVWMPGVGSALSSLSYGAMLAFSSLLATERGWNPVWLPFTAFAFALVAARLLLGHVPDRLGGAKVALACVIIEAVGLGLLWLSPDSAVAALGGALTGFGYSLVYPALGVEAVRAAPPQSRGLAMGAYTVFLDVALGFGSPALGLIAGWAGLSAVFIATACFVATATVIAAKLVASPTPREDPS